MEGYSSVISQAMSLPSAGRAKAMPRAVYLNTSLRVKTFSIQDPSQ